MIHPLLIALEQALAAHEAADAAMRAGSLTKTQHKAAYQAEQKARFAFEQAQRDLTKAGGAFYRYLPGPNGETLTYIGEAPDRELFNPHGHPEDKVRDALAIEDAKKALRAELKRADPEIAEAFARAFTKRAISHRMGHVTVHRDGSLFDGSVSGPRPKDVLRAAVLAELDEAGARGRRMRSLAGRRAGVARAQRREAEVSKVVARWHLEGRFTPAHRCVCCHTELSDPESLVRGIGSECWQHVQDRIEVANRVGNPVNAWDEMIDLILVELPARESAENCAAFGENRYRDGRSETYAGREFCESCADAIGFEAVRRLRPDSATGDGSEFRRWVGSLHFAFADSDVIAAKEAETIAAAAFEAARKPPTEFAAYRAAQCAADQARDARRAAESAARGRFLTERPSGAAGSREESK